jgi:hypothetical protein
MKYSLVYSIGLFIMACNQIKPSAFLTVFPSIVKDDTIYYLKITIKNESKIPLYLENCRYPSQYLKISDYKGDNIKNKFDGWEYFDVRKQRDDDNILYFINNPNVAFVKNAVEGDLKRLKKLNFFLKNDTVYDNAMKRVLTDKYENVLILNPGDTMVNYELMNSFYRKYNKVSIKFKYQNKPWINIIPGFMHLYVHLDGRDDKFFLFQVVNGIDEVNGYERFKGKLVSAPLVIN